MNKNFQQRSELDKAMRDNSAENERLMKELNELFPGRTVTGQDLVRYRLWKEQDGRCAYSIQPLELDKVITVSGYAEVDHIVPYSISFDDRRTNKVLVLASENRQKGNRLPLQYLQGKRRDDFIVYTKANVKNFRKRQNLLKEKLSEEDRQGLYAAQPTGYAVYCGFYAELYPQSSCVCRLFRGRQTAGSCGKWRRYGVFAQALGS